MPNSNLFVAGSIHQGHERFSDISQCFFYEFSALLRAQMLPIEQSTATTIDQILAKGNYCILILLKVDPSMTQTPCPCMDHLPNVTCWSIEHMVRLVG